MKWYSSKWLHLWCIYGTFMIWFISLSNTCSFNNLQDTPFPISSHAELHTHQLGWKILFSRMRCSTLFSHRRDMRSVMCGKACYCIICSTISQYIDMRIHIWCDLVEIMILWIWWRSYVAVLSLILKGLSAIDIDPSHSLIFAYDLAPLRIFSRDWDLTPSGTRYAVFVTIVDIAQL